MKALQLALIAALVLAAPSKANIITNPGFETGDFTGWTLTFDDPADAPFVFVDNFIPHTGTWAALFGNFGDTASLSQTLITSPGASYTFSFWVLNEGAAPNLFAALWDGSPVTTLTDAASFGGTYQQFVVPVTATSNTTTVEFTFLHQPSFWDLDDVSVEEVSSPTQIPEPATISLLGLGLLGLGLLRRRR